MSKISVTVDSDRYKKFLKDAPEKIERIMQNVIYKGAFLIERESKMRAPVDTGRLRASISTDIRPMTATISTNTNYAVYVHDGTRYIKSNPFMKDGAASADQQIGAIIEDEIKSL